MIRVGFAPGAFDLFHIGQLNLLRHAKARCDYVVAGAIADDMVMRQKGIAPVIPLADRLQIVGNVRCVDAAVPVATDDRVEIWKDLQFNVLFKGDDWQGTPKGKQLERDFTALGVEIVYFPYTLATSSSALPRTFQNMASSASKHVLPAGAARVA